MNAQFSCPSCGYIYDEHRGNEHEGFPPGTRWEQIPEDWACPDCAVRAKPDFLPVGVAEVPSNGQPAGECVGSPPARQR